MSTFTHVLAHKREQLAPSAGSKFTVTILTLKTLGCNLCKICGHCCLYRLWVQASSQAKGSKSTSLCLRKEVDLVPLACEDGGQESVTYFLNLFDLHSQICF